MNNRIKKLRKALDLTQQEFADRIGSKRTTIAKYETDTNVPSSAVISLICREFNVSESWLRTGEGEMFIRRTRDDELAAFMDKLLTGERVDFRQRFVTALSRLNSEQWEALETIALGLMKNPVSAAPPPAEQTEATADIQAQEQPDIATELAELKRQNQELAAKVAAMEEKDAAIGLTDVFSTLPSVSAGKFSPGVKK